ncbi:unnamed protein product [Cylindrotheca closterium]|uniref:Uncharacterized protein n=1 Tax=Cylindrotheca closterium TaxID=2856 RepID=A0AAD2JMS2_9STRA|nr:unnamed protein product [Cylindrotheca closterium]
MVHKILCLLVLLVASSSSFTIPCQEGHSSSQLLGSSSGGSEPPQIDISDLGLTMDDLNAPLPSDLLEAVETSGYDSTSRVPDVNDDACFWTETENKMEAIFAIPGLRGQPAMSLSVLTATNTISITAFGQVVWSCILRSEVNPETAVFETEEGSDMIPIVKFEVEKANYGERWGGFILHIGEDSIL